MLYHWAAFPSVYNSSFFPLLPNSLTQMSITWQPSRSPLVINKSGRRAFEIMILMEKAKPRVCRRKVLGWVIVSVLFGLFFSAVLEMLSKPRIFHDAKAELIKGHAIAVSCQSINGTAPVTYSLLKARDVFHTLTVNSNHPVTFTDKPTKDVEYQCLADNCHSHPQLFSEILRVKVIGKPRCREDLEWSFSRAEDWESIRDCEDNGDGTCAPHTADRSRAEPQQVHLGNVWGLLSSLL